MEKKEKEVVVGFFFSRTFETYFKNTSIVSYNPSNVFALFYFCPEYVPAKTGKFPNHVSQLSKLRVLGK